MKISTALDKIDENQLFVPTFQREYVWKRDDARKLIDSLIKEYPTGTMLTWETGNPPELKGPHKYDKKQGAVRILLDGQQRLTTLYMLIRGTVPPYYTEAEILNDTRGLHVNLETLELAYYSKIKMENDPKWQNITKVFNKGVRAKDIVRALESRGEEVSRELDDRLDDNTQAIVNILDREFREQVIPVKASVREAIDIFYKVNASGVALTDAELALAQISGYWPEARDVFKRKLIELQDKGFVFKLDFIVYVLLGCLYHLGSDMRKLHGEENGEAIREAWERLDSQVLDYAVSIMRSHAYVDHTKEINSIYALVPVIVFCFDKQGELLSDEEIRRLVKWFYYSQIRTRYVSQLPQKLDRDLRVIQEMDNPFDELLASIESERRLEITPDEFSGSSISHPLFGLVRWYLKSKGAVCLTTGIRLRQTMGKKYQLEYDHVFPVSKLKNLGYSRENRVKYSLSQELTNRVILTRIANRTKGTAGAGDYLADAVERFPGSLSLQCIPEDRGLWEIDKYEQFLQARRVLLADELNAFLKEITETRPSKASATLEDLIAEGEGDDLEFKSSLRWDLEQESVNRDLENTIAKTVAAFLNGQGGTLLIGVSDDGEVLGLKGDYHTLRKEGRDDQDRFALHLNNVLDGRIGKALVALNVRVSFPEADGTEICRVDVQKAAKPVVISLKGKDGQSAEKFYVRSGRSSQELSKDDKRDYISLRFSE